tara:strand:- start:9390 stop:10832 length:1443 start_codon:yes stop_codon:yes gene_type:complete
MATVLTNKYKQIVAEKIKGLFSTDNVYTFLGRNYAWPSDSSPPSPVYSVNDEYLNHNDILCMKKVTASDVSFVVPKYTWTSGTVYIPYDHTDSALWTNKKFYVVAPNNKSVYKCINNNSGTASTTEPTGTGTSGIIHNSSADGYIWKYLYTISNTDWNKFQTSDWIPIYDLDSDDTTTQWDVQESAIDGAVYRIKRSTENFSSYTVGHSVTLEGDGSNFAGTIAQYNVGSNKYINITNPGSGYKYVSSVKVNGSADVNLTAVLSPRGGHGFDPVHELGGFNVMVSLEFSGNESGNGGIFVDNDFRSVGLILNPHRKVLSDGSTAGSYDDIISPDTTITYGTRSTATCLDQTARITYSSLTGSPGGDETSFSTAGKDQVVTQGTSGHTGRVVNVDTTNNYIYITPTSTSDTFASANNLTCSAGGNDFTIVKTANADYDSLRYSGDILYVENLPHNTSTHPTTGYPQRASGTTETIRVVLKF